jgi:sec-independent protein translocase protein TatA
MGSIGPLEIAMIGLVIIILVGANRIATLGKGLGQGIKNLREAVKDDREHDGRDE